MSDFVAYLMKGVSHHKSASVSQAITTHIKNRFSSSSLEAYILDLFISALNIVSSASHVLKERVNPLLHYAGNLGFVFF